MDRVSRIKQARFSPKHTFFHNLYIPLMTSNAWETITIDIVFKHAELK